MMHDLIVIGAGPAGLAAARQASEAGLSVLLLDEQRHAGGQIYRNVGNVPDERRDLLGKDFAAGADLVEAIARAGVTHVTGASVWQIEDEGRVIYSSEGRGASAMARRILIATGALERAMPIPGWTLPGVMTAGAAQIMLKEAGLVPERAVLAGSGPLLYLVAAQMVRAGTPPAALVETQGRRDTARALRHFPRALRGWPYLVKGLSMLQELRKAGVPRIVGATGLRVDGEDRAEGLSFDHGGKRHAIACDTVLLHHGVVPNTQLARSLGIAHRWDPRQRCFAPDTDAFGRTHRDEILVAGDGGGIGGAKAAALQGRLAALAVAADFGAGAADGRAHDADSIRRDLARELAARPLLDVAYPPYPEALAPESGTIVCRCEEVTAGDIRRYAAMGCKGPNQTKAFGRSGMGPCQGRYCGLAVSEILAAENAQSLDETGYYRIRPPVKPVTLEEVATIEEETVA